MPISQVYQKQEVLQAEAIVPNVSYKVLFWLFSITASIILTACAAWLYVLNKAIQLQLAISFHRKLLE